MSQKCPKISPIVQDHEAQQFGLAFFRRTIRLAFDRRLLNLSHILRFSVSTKSILFVIRMTAERRKRMAVSSISPLPDLGSYSPFSKISRCSSGSTEYLGRQHATITRIMLLC